MELTYLRDLTHNYMVIRPDAEYAGYALRMATGLRAQALIPFELRFINNEPCLYYRIDSLISLENRCLARRLRAGELRALMEALAAAQAQLKEYLLGPETIFLTPETVFYDPSRESWHFICLPFPHTEGSLAAWTWNLLEMADPGDEEAMADVYLICERAQEANVRPSELRQMLSMQEAAEPEEAVVKEEISDEGGWRDLPAFETEKEREEEKKRPQKEKKGGKAVRPGVMALLFLVVFVADLYVRRNYLLTGPGNLLSFVVMGISLPGAVGSFVLSRRKEAEEGEGDEKEEDLRTDTEEEAGERAYGRLYAGEDGTGAFRDGGQEEDGAEEQGTVLLAGNRNRRASKLYGRNKEHNCNIPLDVLPLTVGKLAERVDLALKDRSVSRIHAHIGRDAEGNLIVKDMNSTNGTYHNGIRLRPNETVRMQTGDEICFGNMVFEYL